MGGLFFGSGGFSAPPVAGCGMMLAAVACLYWAAAGRIMLSIGTIMLLGLCFYVGGDPQGAIQSIEGSPLEPTYFGMWRR